MVGRTEPIPDQLQCQDQRQGQDQPQVVTFVASAYNEEKNIEALYRRCLSAFDQLATSGPNTPLQ